MTESPRHSWRRRQVPGKKEWAGFEDDLDVRAAHRLMYGKRADEVLKQFEGGHAISRADELLFMPRRAFQYYVFSFMEYLHSERAKGDSDAASPFLGLLVAREERDPGSVAAIYEQLRETIDYVAENQAYFEADPEIYGSFSTRREEISKLVHAFNAGRTPSGAPR